MSLEIDIKLWNSGASILQAANNVIGLDNSTIHKRYFTELSMNSGLKRRYRGRVIEAATGKDIGSIDKQNITVRVITPAFKSCKSQEFKLTEPSGIFEFGVPLLNNSLPYVI